MAKLGTLEIIFRDDGAHKLVDHETGDETHYAQFSGFTYLKGFVGCTDYYTGKGEAIMTPDEFCKMAGVSGRT